MSAEKSEDEDGNSMKAQMGFKRQKPQGGSKLIQINDFRWLLNIDFFYLAQGDGFGKLNFVII